MPPCSIDPQRPVEPPRRRQRAHGHWTRGVEGLRQGHRRRAGRHSRNRSKALAGPPTCTSRTSSTASARARPRPPPCASPSRPPWSCRWRTSRCGRAAVCAGTRRRKRSRRDRPPDVPRRHRRGPAALPRQQLEPARGRLALLSRPRRRESRRTGWRGRGQRRLAPVRRGFRLALDDAGRPRRAARRHRVDAHGGGARSAEGTACPARRDPRRRADVPQVRLPRRVPPRPRQGHRRRPPVAQRPPNRARRLPRPLRPRPRGLRGRPSALLNDLYRRAPNLAWIRPGAYCFGRPGHLFPQLGPVVATDLEGARAVVDHCLARHEGQAFVSTCPTAPTVSGSRCSGRSCGCRLARSAVMAGRNRCSQSPGRSSDSQLTSAKFTSRSVRTSTGSPFSSVG